MKVWKTIAAAAALALSAGAASATTINLSYRNNSSIFNGNANAGVKLVVDGKSVNAQAGAFALTSPQTGDIDLWCLDAESLIFGKNQTRPYAETDNPFVASGQGAITAAIGGITKLFDKFFLKGDNPVLANNTEAAAFQLTLWRLVYDALGKTFTFDGTNSGIKSRSTAMYDCVVSGSGDGCNSIDRVWRLHFLESQSDPRHQNLVHVTAIPLPAAGLLLITALGGLVVVSRRRKAADA
jgi:hypothetical protein